MAYVIERPIKDGTRRYTGVYKTPDGKYRSAGSYDTHERAIQVAEEEERHVFSLLEETRPSDKATTTIQEFTLQRFLPFHTAGPATRQGYAYTARSHIFPYIGHLRISEVSRETFYNLLVKVLPAQEVSPNVILATRKVLSAMCQMAYDEGYRTNNPIRSIRLPYSSNKHILVASYEQWRAFEEALTYPPARLHARLNVTTWARRCEMISLRPRDFDFDRQLVHITRSTVYVGARYHPTGKAGWLTQPHPKNGDWRRFAISKQMCLSLREHIDEHDIDDDELLFPQWMFAYRRPTPPGPAERTEPLPPLVSKSGKVYQHGTKSARYGLRCTCPECKAYAAEYQRTWRRQKAKEQARLNTSTRADIWRKDGTEFLSHNVWSRFWNEARKAAGLPEGFTPYNARHTGISWAIDKGIDLQKVRQRAGHGSLSVTSRYAAILNEEDTTLADTLETIFDTFNH